MRSLSVPALALFAAGLVLLASASEASQDDLDEAVWKREEQEEEDVEAMGDAIAHKPTSIVLTMRERIDLETQSSSPFPEASDEEEADDEGYDGSDYDGQWQQQEEEEDEEENEDDSRRANQPVLRSCLRRSQAKTEVTLLQMYNDVSAAYKQGR